ncbi:hypothetical protein [Streptomyces sp. NPDC051214]|uniref:hypothetical protein n=1 Tax=Streptomyces sp. NPDC051214 TaxID=3155282 RepID=UPI00342DB24E
MERTIEEARRSRGDRLASDEPGLTVQSGPSIVIFYCVCFAVLLAVALACLFLGSDQWLSVALIAGLAAVVAVRPLIAISAGSIGTSS